MPRAPWQNISSRALLGPATWFCLNGDSLDLPGGRAAQSAQYDKHHLIAGRGIFGPWWKEDGGFLRAEVR